MPERISSHFERVHDLVEQETDDSDVRTRIFIIVDPW